MFPRPLFIFLSLPLFAGTAWSQTAATLRSAADAAGLNIGIATNSFNVTNASYAAVAKAQFNLVVCENEMKFESTEKPIGKFNYKPGDDVYNFASANNMKMRGHNFVWGGQSISAMAVVTNRMNGLSTLRNHIDSVGGHFKTKILEWDVLNEITNDGVNGGLKGIFWMKAIGDDYADSALVMSRRVIGTNGYLYSNDYGADGVNPKSTAIVAMAKKWQTNHVPIDGIGFQCHLTSPVNKADISTNIKRFGDLGLRVSLTEIDIKDATPADWTALMGACLENFNCVSFVTWGLSDANSWIGSSCGCLLYNGGTPTVKTNMYQAVMDALKAADPTIAAKRKAFTIIPAGSLGPTAALSYFTRPAAHRVGALGSANSPVPVFLNGSGTLVDPLGRVKTIAPSAFPAVDILPR